MKKRCPKCKEIKDRSEFNKNKTKKDGLSHHCKECSREYTIQHYKKNKEYYYKREKRSRQRRKKWYVEYKKNLKCKNCGEDRYYVLVFHHRDGKEKEGLVSRMAHGRFSKKKIIKEIEKCDVLCSNCHLEIHYLMEQARLQKIRKTIITLDNWIT